MTLRRRYPALGAALCVVASVVFVATQQVATSVVSAAGSTSGTVAGRV